MRKFVAIDSQVFIWGIKKVATEGQESKVLKTSVFFEYLWDNEYNILIPAPVLGEVLVPVPVEEHATIISLINRRMVVAPFDAPAAAIFAKMFAAYKSNAEMKAYREAHKVPREKVKVDFIIAAIAVANNAECIYSEDNDVIKFASAFIEVKCIPNLPYQIQIDFGNQDNEKQLVNALEENGKGEVNVSETLELNSVEVEQNDINGSESTKSESVEKIAESDPTNESDPESTNENESEPTKETEGEFVGNSES